MNVLFLCRKKGSVILVVVIVFAVLMILLASFHKSTTSRVHTTKKLGDTMLARELANSLAILSNHYIKSVLLKKSDSDLIKILNTPFDKMEDGEGRITDDDLKSYFGEIYTTLIEKSGLNEIKLKALNWKLLKSDFEPLVINGKASPYPREKKGLIRLYTKFSYLFPGTKTPLIEDYNFYSEIRVTANVLPVLSKFSFYVEKAIDTQTINDENILSTYFNVVDTTEGGELNSNSPRPWVINNGNNSVFEDYRDYVADKRGFIYLGGATQEAPVILGIARGFSSAPQGDYGEDFHFYKNGSSGYWKTLDDWGNTNETDETGVTAILEADIGLCNDTTNNFKKWQDNFGAGYDQITRYNSIFRLYGTDKDISPTLVYGYVNSMFGSVRAFKKGFFDSTGKTNWKICKLVFFDHEIDYLNACGYGDGSGNFGDIGTYLEMKDSLMSFATSYNKKFGDDLVFEKYEKDYSTRVMFNRYNKDFTYYMAKTKGKTVADQQYPIDFCPDLIKGDFKKLCENKENDNLLLAVPNADGLAEFRNIYSESTTLENLNDFLVPEKLGFDKATSSTRIGYFTKIDETKDNLDEFFISKGLLKDKDLDLNSWVYVDNENASEVKLNDYKVISQGGIVVANGNIVLNGNIKCDSGAHLTIVALNGNITIERGVDTVDASLIAGGGQVKLEGDEKDRKLMVKGNIVMKNIPANNNKVDYSKMKRGLFLTYNTDLSAIPSFQQKYNVEESKTELPLLMYDLKEYMKMSD